MCFKTDIMTGGIDEWLKQQRENGHKARVLHPTLEYKV
jgi:hypothetical protein